MIYIASPYSHPDLEIMQLRFEQVRDWTCALIASTGLPLFSPISYCHDLCVKHDLPKDAKFWYEFNLAFISRSSEMIVLKLSGWDSSLGVAGEIKLAEELNIPVNYATLPRT